MASEQSGDDHAKTTPKTESLRVPVFWHLIPGTWVSFLTCEYMRRLFSSHAQTSMLNLAQQSDSCTVSSKASAALWPQNEAQCYFYFRNPVHSRYTSACTHCVVRKRVSSLSNMAISIRVCCRESIRFQPLGFLFLFLKEIIWAAVSAPDPAHSDIPSLIAAHWAAFPHSIAQTEFLPVLQYLTLIHKHRRTAPTAVLLEHDHFVVLMSNSTLKRENFLFWSQHRWGASDVVSVTLKQQRAIFMVTLQIGLTYNIT